MQTLQMVTRVPLTAHSFNEKADNVIRVATKVIEHFFSPIRALASKPTFTMTSSDTEVEK